MQRALGWGREDSALGGGAGCHRGCLWWGPREAEPVLAATLRGAGAREASTPAQLTRAVPGPSLQSGGSHDRRLTALEAGRTGSRWARQVSF